uniref:Solute carrier family 66 member 3 n=1 Tax=Hirondellea gigas TaxID=1518452 RepID=A0A6A7FUJ1_9CRUS
MAANLLQQAILLVVTPKCYEEFFHEMNFTDVECLKGTLSKGLGLGIILGSIMVKIPQIIKIQRAKSAYGISFFATTLEIVAVIASFSYNFVNGYPFSSYGDVLFLLVQTGIIGALVLHYNGASQQAFLFLAVVAGAAATLCSGAIPMRVLWGLQAANIPIIFTAKMLQAHSNYSAGSTGQLSGVTVTLLTAGSAARIFTSIQETGDIVIIATYCVATFANSIIFFQLLWYWNAQTKGVAKGKKGSKQKKN